MQLDPIGALFSKSWQRYQELFPVLAGIFLPPLAILGIGQLLLKQHTVSALLLGAVLALIGVVLSLIASIAMVAAIGKNEDFGTAYQTGFKLFWASIWIAILVDLAGFGGFVLLIIPGIMLGIQLALVQYALVLEDKTGLAALTQSREYIKGYWWAFVGRTFLLGLVLGAIMLVIYLPFQLIIGGIVAALIYGILLLLFTPFSAIYSFEIFDNLRRLKPDLANATAKAETGFLKVCMVLGVVGIIGFIILFGALIAFFVKGGSAYPPGGGFSYPPVMESSTVPGEGFMQLSPTSGPVGTKVTISGPISFDATNTIFMNGNVAARNAALSASGTLSFVIPGSLGPDCDPHQAACPQFLVSVTPGDYGVAERDAQGVVSAGIFTVTAK